MGCQSEVKLESDLTFSICTHNAETGVLTNADASPTFRIYEDDTGTSIMTGTMAAIDAGNTTGFYLKKIACTDANGFEANKSYSIYITAIVGGYRGGISFGFKVSTEVDILNYDLDGGATVETAWKFILAYCAGNIERIGGSYTYRNFDNTSDIMTFAASDTSRERV